jgi:hypothetical protein
MNLKGQWNQLKKYQQYKLTHYAILKEWKSYWYYKQLYLTINKYGDK